MFQVHFEIKLIQIAAFSFIAVNMKLLRAARHFFKLCICRWRRQYFSVSRSNWWVEAFFVRIEINFLVSETTSSFRFHTMNGNIINYGQNDNRWVFRLNRGYVYKSTVWKSLYKFGVRIGVSSVVKSVILTAVSISLNVIKDIIIRSRVSIYERKLGGESGVVKCC